jgi:hypothetical protein
MHQSLVQLPQPVMVAQVLHQLLAAQLQRILVEAEAEQIVPLRVEVRVVLVAAVMDVLVAMH